MCTSYYGLDRITFYARKMKSEPPEDRCVCSCSSCWTVSPWTPGVCRYQCFLHFFPTVLFPKNEHFWTLFTMCLNNVFKYKVGDLYGLFYIYQVWKQVAVGSDGFWPVCTHCHLSCFFSVLPRCCLPCNIIIWSKRLMKTTCHYLMMCNINVGC